MPRRITYHAAPGQVWPLAAEQPQAQTPDGLAAKLKAAIVAGVSLSIILLVFLIGILTFFDKLTVQTAQAVVLLVMSLGIVYGAYLALRWAVTVAARPWEIDDKERERRWELEDREQETLNRLKDQTQEDAQANRAETVAKVPILALELLRRHFLGLPTTRSQCVKEGICTATDWNLVNRLLVDLGLKTNKTMTPGDSLIEAWNHWQQNVKVENGHVWKTSSAGGWELVE
jgi:hypothetical protein